MLKKGLALIITVVMVLTMVPAAVFAADTPTYSDMPNDWSKTALENAVKNGLISGYPDATIRAGKSLSRAEMVTIVAKAFGATTEADISRVQDVKSGDWFYSYIAKSIGMEGIAFATVVRPKDSITREEAFTVLNKVMLLMEGQDVDKELKALNKYSDVSNVSNYARGFVNEMSANGYVTGNANGRLNPKGNITRAEFAAVMDNMFKEYLAAPTAQTKPVASGNVVVTSGGALKDVTINGDLVLADGIGNKEIKLDNVTIKGRLVVRGGSKIEFTGKVEKDIIIWAKDCVVYANSGRDSFREEIITEHAKGTVSRVVLPSTGGGGGSGGGSSVTRDYTLALKGSISVGSHTKAPTITNIKYALSESVETVINRVATNTQTKEQIYEAYDEAIAQGKSRGFLTDDLKVKNIGIPAGDAVTNDVLNSDKVRNEVTTTLKQDTATKNDIKEALKVSEKWDIAIDDNAAVDAAIDVAVDQVLEALTGEASLDYADPVQKVVVETLQTKINAYPPAELHEKISADETYSEYLSVLGSTPEEQIAALGDTVKQYDAQLTEMLQKFPAKSRISVYASDVEIKYLQKDDSKLQTYIIIDPIKVAQEQFEARKNTILDQVKGDTKTDLEKILNTWQPINLFDGRTVKDKSDYVTLFTNTVRDLLKLSPDWEPATGTQLQFIDNLIAKVEANSNGTKLTDAQKNVLYYLSGAKEVEGAKQQGVDMTMETFWEKVLGTEPATDKDKELTIDELSFQVSDLANVNASGMQEAIDWIVENYGHVTIKGSMTINLNQQSK